MLRCRPLDGGLGALVATLSGDPPSSHVRTSPGPSVTPGTRLHKGPARQMPTRTPGRSPTRFVPVRRGDRGLGALAAEATEEPEKVPVACAKAELDAADCKKLQSVYDALGDKNFDQYLQTLGEKGVAAGCAYLSSKGVPASLCETVSKKLVAWATSFFKSCPSGQRRECAETCDDLQWIATNASTNTSAFVGGGMFGGKIVTPTDLVKDCPAKSRTKHDPSIWPAPITCTKPVCRPVAKTFSKLPGGGKAVVTPKQGGGWLLPLAIGAGVLTVAKLAL